MAGATLDVIRVDCPCGAVGHVLPSDLGYEPRDLRTHLMEWRGGSIGTGRVAVEVFPLDVTVCPVCQHRACAYVNATSGRSRRE
jgi:hypothetical protein